MLELETSAVLPTLSPHVGGASARPCVTSGPPHTAQRLAGDTYGDISAYTPAAEPQLGDICRAAARASSQAATMTYYE